MKFQHYLSSLILIIFSLAFVSCSKDIYRDNNKAHEKAVKEATASIREIPKTKAELNYDTLSITDEWVGTTNFSIRKPNYVIIHHTAQDSLKQTINTFTLSRTQVSSHYVVGRDGEIVQMLNDYLRSWHAGNGRWGNDTDLNSASIGIELDNNGSEPFTEAQIESLLLLLKRLKWKFGIPAANFIGHSDIAPSRKVDPSTYFPWRKLAQEGYGIWYDEEAIFPVLSAHEYTSIPIESTDDLPQEFLDLVLALRIIGYNVSDPKAAIRAFKLHFIQRDIESELTETDKRILDNLYKKYL
ncbi:N-acetyl-anhydromuramyl-L-alanine amidase AmpD [Algoriphagus ratkowskyi]|uniref:N-acetylmuramoyl-L-alanine amidase n=1 Tax=Algoriphagus ratkowskyi TaxID=57028 RepID=A0A2W7RP64_9BACT|nr:N-acetylmuramoyl-L-alanine amidase [Algoriphagus ratkowskyi]PZX60280.1 N-acetyl-anhydromuramyl-L-alanine amidase AmpD [Algoriphagus ratkowskyi]TXD78097.1 N-acetylmuramoyl-L-alanine amidase [Algoriphagus ratkowskyi]